MSKRILSLVLALVMVLGTFGTVFADTATDHDPKVQWLIDQGLLQGDGSGDYGLTKTVTRDVLARIVAVALQDEVSAMSLQALPSGFADMTPAHWANGYASYANAKGYMIGNAKREFMPAGTVSYAEALVVLTKIALNGDLTAAEKANALTWYAPYVAKANEIGVTEGVAIANVGAPAVKEDILKMLYNVLNNKNFGNYNVIKAIVLENDRIARIGANEVTVEVIKEVQRANFVEETRKDLKGEQYTYELPAKFNAEDLLGKVVDLSIDKNGKVVEVKVDTTYEVLTGAVWGITPSRLTINNKQYIVNLDERYNKEDERVYRTYLNDKDLKYSEFAKDNEEVEYARVTVKAGKVLFIDAYDFNDIMPVKEVKEVRGKNTILSYDDVRNNNLIETEVKSTRVILVNGKTFTRGTLEDVKADNVIHTYKVGSSTKYMVLQDKAIVGKLERIKEDKDGFYVVVAGEEYTIPETSPKEAVYEFQTDGKFYTLEAKSAYRELDNFRGEEVKVLLALSEDLQYIGSNVGFGEFMGVATRVVGKEMRVVTPENKSVDYTSNLDTDVYVEDSNTAHQGLNKIKENSLVYVNADGETLVEVRDFNKPVAVTSFSSAKEINGLRITDDTVVYVVNSSDRVEVRKIADVFKAYDNLTAADKAKVKVALINEYEYDKISTRGYKFANSGHVHTMVLYDLNIKAAQKDAIYGKLISYDDRKIGKSTITVELTNGSRRTFTLDANVDETKVNFVKGNIYKINESKETEDLALVVTKVAFKHGKIEDIKNYLYTFTDGIELYETRSTEIFGRRPRANDEISYLADGKDMVVIVYPAFEGVEDKTPSGVVTYINATGVIEIDGVVYSITDTTVLRNELGIIEQTGKANIGAALVMNTDKVFDVVADSNKVISSMKYVASATHRTMADDTIDMIEALDSTKATFAADVLAARNKYTAVSAFPKVKNLIPASVLAKLVAAEKAVEAKIVADAKEALTLGDTSAVTANLTLPAAPAGTTVTWKSSDATVLTDAGVVIRPDFVDGDKTVTLTATITSTADATVKDTKVFTVKVIKKAETEQEAATRIANGLALTFATGDSATSVTGDITLPTNAEATGGIVWSSSNTAVLTDAGVVTRPSGQDIQVTLTATVTVTGTPNGVATKVFVLTIKAQ